MLTVPAGMVLGGIQILLDTPANWTATGLDWSVTYPTASAMTQAPHASSSTPATVLSTGVNGTLVDIHLTTPLDTDLIAAQPYGGTDAYERRIEIGLVGTITGGTVFPQISRIWPDWEREDKDAYADYTSILQPMAGTPNYSSWPGSITVHAGDETLFGCEEWPVSMRMIIDSPSTTTGSATYRYSASGGMTSLPAEYNNDPSDFGRSAAGEYQIRVGKPQNAAKMWLMTYTLNGDTKSVFQVAEPTLPAGAVQVRKEHLYFWGRRYDADSTSLNQAFNMRIACRELNPLTMVSTMPVLASDALKTVFIDADEATGAPGESSWFIVNSEKGTGVLVRDTLTLTKTSMSADGLTLQRSGGDGFIAIKIKDKPTANAEASGGSIVIIG